MVIPVFAKQSLSCRHQDSSSLTLPSHTRRKNVTNTPINPDGRAVESRRLDHRRQAELLLDKVLSARTSAPRPPRRARTSSSTAEASRDHCPGNEVNRAAPYESASAHQTSNASTEPPPKLGLRVGIAGPPGAGKSSFIEVNLLSFSAFLTAWIAVGIMEASSLVMPQDIGCV